MEVSEIEERGSEAFRRAMEELERGRGVFLPRPDLTLEEEAKVKRKALERGLLVFGPGCGSSCLEGRGFGIWNSTKEGPVGIVSTGGSGIRELCALLQDVGISNSICVGPRDLSQKVGGSGTIAALKYLASDSSTEVIVLAAINPSATMAKVIFNEIESCKKPVLVCFLGEGSVGVGEVCRTFEVAAIRALGIMNIEPKFCRPSSLLERAVEEHSRFGYGQKYVRGLFCGGMLCIEAQTVLRRQFASVYSNVPLSPRARLPDPHSSKGHACVDMGDSELSEIHPAIDVLSRCRRLLREAGDLEAAVILLDVVLGNGAHPDPAEEFVKAIKKGREKVEETGGYLSIVASLIGTRRDPQGLPSQRKKLEKAGVILMPSNASASELAAMIVKPGVTVKQFPQP